VPTVEPSRGGRTRRAMAARERIGPPVATYLLLAGLIVTWEVLARRSLVATLFFPPPSLWLGTGLEMLRSGMLVGDIVATGRPLTQGLLGGAALGYTMGAALGSSRRWYETLNPFVAFVHPLPKITLYPLLLIVLGLGDAPRIAVITIAAFFPIFVTTVLGVRGVDPTLLEVAKSLRASRILVIKRIILPASIPASLAGLRLSFNSALTSAIALEFVSSGDGLGSRLWTSWQNLRTDRLLVAMTAIALIGYFSNVALQALQTRLTPWASEDSP
jgi:ABC-type nitrate/sulfonate/bicarbonate transport system permease component